MNEIEDLKKKELDIRNRIYELRQNREEELLPKHRKHYIGKCFKYRNSYGRDSEKWWLYIKVLDVVSINFSNNEEPIFKVVQMECPSDQSILTKINEHQYIREEYIQITCKEFIKAKNTLIKNLKDYLD